jgi:hypothetical protein
VGASDAAVRGLGWRLTVIVYVVASIAANRRLG